MYPAVLLLASDAAFAAQRANVRFDIPAQSLESALLSFSEQARIQLVVANEKIKGLRAPGVQGEYSPNDALALLLQGSGLVYRETDERTIAISDASQAQVGAPTEQNDLYLARAESTTAQQAGTPDANDQNGDAAQKYETGGDASGYKQELQEIVVTAQKREERLQDVPISISVLSGRDLDRSADSGLNDALRRVPGVALHEMGLGGGAQLMVRGVAASMGIWSGSSPTAYYLDGIPSTLVRSAMVPDLSAYDLERVEALRGPQGTLYGASALNGVVRVLSKDANLSAFEFKARTSASGTQGGGENYRGDLAVNVPLVEGKLAARAVVGYQNLSGWIDKPNMNKEDANDAELGNMRFKLYAQPTEQLSIGLSAWLSRADRDAMSNANDEAQNPAYFDEPSSIDSNLYGLTIGYDSRWFSVTSTTGYVDYANEFLLDIGAPALVGGFRYSGNVAATSFSQEVILNSTRSGSWRWSVGSIYRDAKDADRVAIANVQPTLSRAFKSESYAVFGELTRLLLEGRLELTAGLRHFEDEIGQREYSRTGVVSPPGGLVSKDDKFHATTPRLAVTWHPGELATVYASYGEGFRSGLQQNPPVLSIFPLPPAEPDGLKNYEVGAKGNLLGGRLALETAVYYIDWEDAQQSIIVEVPVANTAVGVLAFINGQSASGMGVDFGVTSRPFDRLELGVNFNWNDLKMDADVLSGGIPLFDKGDRLNFSPEYTVGFSADYVVPVGRNGFEAHLSASAHATAEQESRGIAAGAPVIARSDRTWFGRTSLSLQAPSHWAATLFVDNINNESGSPSGNAVNASGTSDHWPIRVRPRTIGVQLEYQF